MDFFAVKVNKMTGSDVIVGTLLERNGVCNGELYVFHERIWREFLLLNTCQIDVYSVPCPPARTMTSLPVTILTAKKNNFQLETSSVVGSTISTVKLAAFLYFLAARFSLILETKWKTTQANYLLPILRRNESTLLAQLMWTVWLNAGYLKMIMIANTRSDIDKTGFTLLNHFPSNGVATDPRQCFLVFLTHLNSDALYFHLNLLFQS